VDVAGTGLCERERVFAVGEGGVLIGDTLLWELVGD